MFGAAGAVAALAACGDGGSKPDARTVRVGLLAPKSGPYASIGADISDGFRLYLRDHDQTLDGRPVEVLTGNEGTSVDVARAATQSLLSQRVHVLIGVASPAALAGIKDLVEQARTPLISANGSQAEASYIWRASYADGQASAALADYLTLNDPYRRAYVLRDDTDQARVETAAFRRAFAVDGRQVIAEVVATGSFKERLAAAGASGADVLYAAYSGDAGWQLVQAYGDASVNQPLVGPGMLTESRDLVHFASRAKHLPTVLTTMNYAANLANPANRSFASGYSQLTGLEPTSYAVAAYDAGTVIDLALRLTGKDLDPDGLNKAIGMVGEIASPRGTWTFTNARTPQQQWYLRKLSQSGQVPANLVAADLPAVS